MKKFGIYILLLSLSVTIPLFAGGDVNATMVASYQYHGKKIGVTVSDVRKDLMMVVEYQGFIINNKDLLKKIFSENYLEPKLKTIEIAETGFTNTPVYQEKLNKAKEMQYYVLLNRYGQDIISALMTNGKFMFAKASHILLSVPENANVGGHYITLSPEKIEEKSQKQEKIAWERLAVLKKSADLDTDFAEMAEKISDDPLSAEKGGDLGYFSEYVMVKEFSDAVFGMITKGLVPQPVKTKFGWHLIYVTVPPKMTSYSALQKEMGDMAKGLWDSVANGLKSKNIVSYYEVDYKTSRVLVDGMSYALENLPPGIKLLEIWGEPYTWGKCRTIIDIFVPGFSSNITMTSFGEQMGNCKEFMYLTGKALKDGVDKQAEFQAEYKKEIEQSVIGLCVSEFDARMKAEAAKFVTLKNIKNYYNEHKTAEFQEIKKDIKGDFIMNKETGLPEMETMPLEMISNKVMDILRYTKQQDLTAKWKVEAFKKYHVEISDTGIAVLQDMLKKEMKGK